MTALPPVTEINPSDRSTAEKIWRAMGNSAPAWGIILIGVLDRVYRFMQPRGVMHSESVLDYNILTRGFWGLLKPLESDQASPVGFLWMQKCATLCFGANEQAMRVVPLLAGIVALPLFYRLARSLLSAQGAVIALAFLAFSEHAVYYSVEGKQYSTDVLWTIVAVMVALCATTRAGIIRLGIVGIVLIWFSHPMLFVLGGIGLALAWEHWRRKDWELLQTDLAAGAGWVASFGINYWCISRFYTSSSYLTEYWENQNAFAPLLPRNAEQWLWYPRMLRTAFEFPVGVAPEGNAHFSWILWVAAAVFCVGCLLLAFRNGRVFRTIVGTLVLALLASGLHRYPFGDRLILFAMPLFILPLAVGIESFSPIPVRLGLMGIFFVYPVYMQVKYTIHRPVWYDVKPAIAYVKANWKDGDALYLPWGSDVLGRYYLETQPGLGIAGARPISGVWKEDAGAREGAYEEDLRPLFGKPRVWIVFSMDPLHERGVYEKILLGHGKMIDHYDYQGGAAELYDLR
jgi:hypothetical protein